MLDLTRPANNEHLELLSQIALYCSDVSNVAKLADAFLLSLIPAAINGAIKGKILGPIAVVTISALAKLELLSQIALYCSDVSNVAKLADATTKAEIINLLKEVGQKL